MVTLQTWGKRMSEDMRLRDKVLTLPAAEMLRRFR
jgi:hypothetical protein